MDRDLLRGTIPTLVLAILAEGPQYGFKIAEIIRTRTGENFALALATLYNSLKNLEQLGFIHSYWRDEGGRRPRHYYEILPEGTEHLNARLAEWKRFTDSANAVFFVHGDRD